MMKKSRYLHFISKLANIRILLLIVFSFITYYLLGRYRFSIWWVVAFGSIIGLIWGKVFCRWMCPIGLMMEFFMKINPDDKMRNMYQYHKLGCPIAWISGFFNRFSLFQISVNKQSCTSCGKCDKVCYMPQIDKQKYSLFKPGKKNPGIDYTCSKCLKCVSACPNGSLTYSIKKYEK